MSIKVVKTEPSHFDLIEFRDEEARALALDPYAQQRFIMLGESGSVGTVMYDGRILCIMGHFMLWPGVWEIFTFPSKYIDRYAYQYLKYSKRYLKTQMSVFGIRRYQTTSLDNEVTNRWMEFLGFTKEGNLKGYGPDGADYCSWRLISGE
jgi:hypothetical protein